MSNKQGICGGAPNNNGLEVKFLTLRRFYSFFPKNNVFLGRLLVFAFWFFAILLFA